jgi:hypothetical protein
MSEYISLGDIVRFGITISNPSGGALINADETPRFYFYRNNSDIIAMQGNFVSRANLIGTYLGSGIVSVTNGFAANDFIEIHASGKVNNVQGRAIIKDFVIDDIYNVNVLTISGIPVTVDDDTFFANIKFIKDSANSRDEYVVQWFKNAVPLASGQVTNAALSVYRTNENTALFTNKIISYSSVNHGGLRGEESTAANLAYSGEPYMAVASGTIDSATRVWQNIIGLDYL